MKESPDAQDPAPAETPEKTLKPETTTEKTAAPAVKASRFVGILGPFWGFEKAVNFTHDRNTNG